MFLLVARWSSSVNIFFKNPGIDPHRTIIHFFLSYPIFYSFFLSYELRFVWIVKLILRLKMDVLHSWMYSKTQIVVWKKKKEESNRFYVCIVWLWWVILCSLRFVVLKCWILAVCKVDGFIVVMVMRWICYINELYVRLLIDKLMMRKYVNCKWTVWTLDVGAIW